MTLPEAFIRRPVATILLTIGIALTGVAAWFVLPVSSLPSVDFPTIQVRASMAGASPEVMATSVATPLERHLGLIANVTEMTSNSTLGSTNITLQFGLNRDINGAARDVQAAIAAARVDLPTALRQNPTYRMINPADAPIVVLYLQSDTMTTAQIYDAASNVLQQKLSQIDGVGDVSLGGGAAPAVRVEYNPRALASYGISPEDVRAAISAANANEPKGYFSDGNRQLQIYTNDQAFKASDYAGLVIATRNGTSVRLSDVATVLDGPEDNYQLGLANGKPAIVVRVTKVPGANIIATVDRIKAALPVLRAEMPPQVDLDIAVDRTITTRASLADVERTLAISTILVVIVVFLFLRNGRATLIPAIAVIVSLLGALGFMYLFNLSLDNLSFMALTVATGFVVDDAIVVLENITRHVEDGMTPFQAALRGASEVAFTVVSISISLIAVFIPLLFMGGIVGRLFNEFSVVLSASVLISLLVSLTTTPMLSARLIDQKHKPKAEKVKPSKAGDKTKEKSPFFTRGYEKALNWAIDHKPIVLIVLLVVIALNVYLYIIIPKGFMPQQDTGQIQGGLQVDQASSFALTAQKMLKLQAIVSADPAVENVVGFTQSGGGFTFGQLKPKAERGGLSSDQVLARLRPKLARVPGAQLFLQVAQDFRVGGRQSNLQYQYTLESDDTAALKTWSDALMREMLKRTDVFSDVSTDQQVNGLESYVNVDRPTASKLGLTSQQVDAILYDAFGQRQVSNIYEALNQYHVVEEADPVFGDNPQALLQVMIPPASGGAITTKAPAQQLLLSAPAALAETTSPATTMASATSPANELISRTPVPAANPFASVTAGGNVGVVGAAATNGQSAATLANLANGVTGSTSALSGAGVTASTTGGGSAQTGNAVTTTAERMSPLTAFTTISLAATPVAINHQDSSVAATLSFNLAAGKSLSDAQTEIQNCIATIGMPRTIHGSFGGTAATAQQSNSNQGLLILAAIVTIYIVLGILYESYVHPITVLSTLPSAGIGALLALMAFHTEFSLIALIGVILLIGIVKKNAILIIDFALARERAGWSPEDAIFEACRLRFRPIMMTTAAAVLGAVPLAIGFGEGSELRQPLGVTIIGGLIASQALTLLTTPVVYLYMDKVRTKFGRKKPKKARHGVAAPSAEGA